MAEVPTDAELLAFARIMGTMTATVKTLAIVTSTSTIATAMETEEEEASAATLAGAAGTASAAGQVAIMMACLVMSTVAVQLTASRTISITVATAGLMTTVAAVMVTECGMFMADAELETVVWSVTEAATTTAVGKRWN